MFIGHDLHAAKKTSSRVFAEAAKIFTYFNTSDTFLDSVIEQRELFYCFIKGPSTDHLTIGGLIEHMHKVCDLREIVTDTPLFPVLSCGSSCMSFAGELDRAARRKTIPTNFLEFYDDGVHLGPKDRRAYESLVASFNYTNAKDEFVSMIGSETKHLQEHLSSPELAAVPVLKGRITPDMLRSADTMDMFSKGLAQVLSAVSAYENLSVWLSVGNSVATLFQDRNMVEYVAQQRALVQQLNSDLMSVIDLYRSNYRLTMPIIDTEAWVHARHRKYPWYRDSAATIVGLVARFRQDEKELYKPTHLHTALLPREEKGSILPPNRATKLVRGADGVPVSVTFK